MELPTVRISLMYSYLNELGTFESVALSQSLLTEARTTATLHNSSQKQSSVI